MLQFDLEMEVVFENRVISTKHPGFADMREFFMDRSPGPFGAMLGQHQEFDLPIPVFTDSLRSGLNEEDSSALTFRYGSVADFVGARNVQVLYDREGDPLIKINGDNFPNTSIYLDMMFLKNRKTSWQGYIFSEGLVLESWEEWNLRKLEHDDAVELEVDGVYKGHIRIPAIARQFARYPDLSQVMLQFIYPERDSLHESLEALVATWDGDYKVYSDDPPSPGQKKVMEHYRVFKYLANPNSFVPTLNETVDETKTLIPKVENAYLAAKELTQGVETY